jgi:glucosyl-dolichyl phosphate glucuronosyltransferase
MRISVILCTHNRSRSLGKALESLAALKMPASEEWDVIVVDNNSADPTRSVVEEFCRRDPLHFRYLFEPRQGKSHALNAGIAHASADILAFTDDDVAVEPTWLYELTHPLEDPKWAGTGGRVFLPMDFVPPPWLRPDDPSSILGILAYFDPGPEPGTFPKRQPPVGANMAYRKKVFSRYGGFRTDLGPRPGRAVRYEDTEFGWRLLNAGERIKYVPSAIVHHEVSPERLKKKYFLVYFYGYGRAAIRDRGKGQPLWLIPRSLISLANRTFSLMPRRISRWLRQSDPGKRFEHKCYVWMMAGEMVELALGWLVPQTKGSFQAHAAKEL